MRFIHIVYIVVCVLAVTFIITTMAGAHDWYSDNRNPATGVGCCGVRDCASVEVERIQQTPDEFIVDGIWHFKISEAIPSQDGGYHACIWGGKPRCFFYPTNT